MVQTVPAKPAGCPISRRAGVKTERLLFLENGDRLAAPEFMRRYEAMPDPTNAQLIEGLVHLSFGVRAETHARPHGMMLGWLGIYSILYEEIVVFSNATLILDADNAVQPDAMLCSRPQPGGRVWLDDKGYLHGSPELVCEIAASSASIDLHSKFQAYRRNGVLEYLVWLTEENAVRWYHLDDGKYVEQKAKAGLLTSRVFPGLVLDTKALLRGDKAKLAAALKMS